jgi:LemA protein
MWWIWIIVAVVVIIFIAIIVGMYNGLVRLRNQVKNAWAQIDVQLKRRFDLIPNLMETVKGYMHHERETMEAVTKARTAAQMVQNAGPAQRGPAEGALGQALGRLFAVAENYPDLKASQNFLAFQEELTSTENKIAFSRQYYNDSVLRFNNKIQMFPSNMMANMFGFKASEFFEVTVPEQREAPKVSFS